MNNIYHLHEHRWHDIKFANNICPKTAYKLPAVENVISNFYRFFTFFLPKMLVSWAF